MITENRDPSFWTRIASHPACAQALCGLSPARIAEMAALPTILPLASENGGFLFTSLDGWGATWELHTLFTPEGWGREVHRSAKEALLAFEWSVIVTFETSDSRSQPPRSFGFSNAGPRRSPIGDVNVWTLTRPSWEASKAHRSIKCQ